MSENLEIKNNNDDKVKKLKESLGKNSEQRKQLQKQLKKELEKEKLNVMNQIYKNIHNFTELYSESKLTNFLKEIEQISKKLKENK